MNRNFISRSLFVLVISLAVLVLPHVVRGQDVTANGNPTRVTIKSEVLSLPCSEDSSLKAEL